VSANLRHTEINSLIEPSSCLKLKPPPPPPATGDVTDDGDTGDGDDVDLTPIEEQEILDGPPPDVPPQPAPPENFAVPAFDQAVRALKQLITKPLKQFANRREHDEAEAAANDSRIINHMLQT
jgi:hypothetical protein